MLSSFSVSVSLIQTGTEKAGHSKVMMNVDHSVPFPDTKPE
jgi:hypothetical protein